MFVAIKTPADVLAMQCKYVECMMVATGWGTKVIAPQEYCGTIEKMYANLFVEKAKNAMNFSQSLSKKDLSVLLNNENL